MRVASKTVEECEVELGPRGMLRVVTSPGGNRDLVRKWYVAQGFTSSFACGLTASRMEAGYNDATDAEIIRMHALDINGKDNADKVAPAFGPAPSVTVNGQGDAQSRLAAAILELASQATPKQAPLDEMRVREIAHEEARKASAPQTVITQIEIRTESTTRLLSPALRHYLFEEALRVISVGVPLAMVGGAGSGKTTACEQVAGALEQPFYINGAISAAHELVGFVDATGNYHRTPCRDAVEHGGIWCSDEFDACTDPAAPLVLNSLLANGYMPFPDQTLPVKKHEQFRAVVTLNTFGLGADRQYVGRTQMDAATLDRFYFLAWDYDADMERIAAGGQDKGNARSIRRKRDNPTADQWIDRVQAIRAAIAHEKVRMIVSPRASINGVKLFAAGLSQEQIENGMIWKGCDQETRRRIEQRAGIVS